jgi:hypothetical protein
MSCGKALIETGKNNLTLKAYPGYDHGFCRNMPDGRADFEDSVFGEVIEGGGL